MGVELEHWITIIVALVGGGSIGAILDAGYKKRSLATQTAKEAVAILTDNIINPLRKQVADDQERISRLEKDHHRLMLCTAYIRSQNHWLNQLCETGIVEDEWMIANPKPRLPDELRDDIDPIMHTTKEGRKQ